MPDEYIMDSPFVSVQIFFLLTASVGVVEVGNFTRSVMLATSTVQVVWVASRAYKCRKLQMDTVTTPSLQNGFQSCVPDS